MGENRFTLNSKSFELWILIFCYVLKFLSYLLSHLSFPIRNHLRKKIFRLSFLSRHFYFSGKGQFQVQKCSSFEKKGGKKVTLFTTMFKDFELWKKRSELQKHGQFLKKKVCRQYAFFIIRWSQNWQKCKCSLTSLFRKREKKV